MDTELFKSETDSSTAGSIKEPAGGYQNKWKAILENISQNISKNQGRPMGGNPVEDLEHVINKTTRFNCPITLNPSESTFLDVAMWAHYHKRLSRSTIEKHIRYAKFMANHKVPVDFNNPNYENFRYHMDFREEIEGASPNALIHEWKAMRLFLNAYGMPIWPYKPPIAPVHNKRIIPFPDIVREFFYYPFSKNPYENSLYQYLFYHSFLIGWRVPSEICEMTLDDIIIDSHGHGSITITETKKRKSQREIIPELFILNSKSHKSLLNWIDKWRPRVENQYSGDALYLWPSGKPVTVRRLGHKLSEHGKKIWPHFKPYDCRHWCAIARLIETKITTGTFDPYIVKNWLGHEVLTSTEQYLRHALQYYNQFRESWIHRALRSLAAGHSAVLKGKHHGLKSRVAFFCKTLLKSSSVGYSKPLLAHEFFQEKTQGEFAKNIKLCFLESIKSFSLNLFSFYFPFNDNYWGGAIE